MSLDNRQSHEATEVPASRVDKTSGGESPEFEIRLATTVKDHVDTRRFWYAVCCEERGLFAATADHEARELRDTRLATSNLFIARDGSGSVCGSVMTTYARSGHLGDYEDFYEMARLGEDHPGRSAITTKLMVSKAMRGSRLGMALVSRTFEQCIEDSIRSCVIDCNRNMLPFFIRLGCTDHAGWKHHPEFGEVCVMAMRPFRDREHLRAIGSPLAGAP